MDKPKQHILPMGAPPFAKVEVIDARELMTEPQDMGDALALDNAVVEAAQQSYVYRWYDYRGRGGAA